MTLSAGRFQCKGNLVKWCNSAVCRLYAYSSVVGKYMVCLQ